MKHSQRKIYFDNEREGSKSIAEKQQFLKKFQEFIVGGKEV